MKSLLHLQTAGNLTLNRHQSGGETLEREDQSMAENGGGGLSPITSGTVYPLSVFQERAGIGKHALRTLKRQGLRIIHPGGERGRGFVRGSDFLELLDRLAREQEGPRQ